MLINVHIKIASRVTLYCFCGELLQCCGFKQSFVLLETSSTRHGSSGDCYCNGDCFCSHVYCTFDLVSCQLFVCQLWSPPYAQTRGENVRNYRLCHRVHQLIFLNAILCLYNFLWDVDGKLSFEAYH